MKIETEQARFAVAAQVLALKHQTGASYIDGDSYADVQLKEQWMVRVSKADDMVKAAIYQRALLVVEKLYDSSLPAHQIATSIDGDLETAMVIVSREV